MPQQARSKGLQANLGVLSHLNGILEDNFTVSCNNQVHIWTKLGVSLLDVSDPSKHECKDASALNESGGPRVTP